jgi:hypothetical protein
MCYELGTQLYKKYVKTIFLCSVFATWGKRCTYIHFITTRVCIHTGSF